MWRANKKRLLVLTELDKHGIDLHTVRCPACDDEVETVDHALFYCKNSVEIWSKVSEWWGLTVPTQFGANIAFGEDTSITVSSLGGKIWQAVRCTCRYLLWKNRNKIVFKKVVGRLR
ncbi:uncharacterized protein [Rutidosis leptorrhynchoides]|uniref:uncharacterized protein n=1 Tax=Rutidosis leptorrhynchoides TaxID=125765 RepID=UPI003A9A0AC0